MYRLSSKDQRQRIHTPSNEAAPGYTPKELEAIRVALNRKLGPEYISKRKGPGYNSVQYLEGWKAINLANEIFGPTGWNTELREFKVDYIDERNGAISLGLSCIVRVILKDGTFHEDVGYGSIENCKGKAMAFDKCKKEAFTDGMKRALRQFGNALGNCLYDKEFLQQITKVSRPPTEFDENELMRRSSTVPAKPNTRTEMAPDIDDGIKADGRKLLERNTGKDKEELEDSFMFSDDWPDDDDVDNEILNSNNFNKEEELPPSDFEGDVDMNAFQGESTLSNINKPVENKMDGTKANNETADISNNSFNSTSMVPEQVTFVSATSADSVQQDPTLQNSLKYDLSFNGRHLNKSSFIVHTKSLPVKKSQVQAALGNKSKSNTENSEDKITTAPSTEITVNTSDDTNTNTLHPTTNSKKMDRKIKNRINVNLNPMQTSNVSSPLLSKRSFGLPPDKLPQQHHLKRQRK
ncbi:DNA repair and recombination protein rad22 [Pichia kudriavzevii]|uniref:DNA repair and recombination protein RAD52 n=1 Tax=Pichia kudriavzevii TaxID=4909 RepID=A0A1V2LT53_PICKU|nr:DNA repair and recombination protein rad22 [Pichia kudriavzevii]